MRRPGDRLRVLAARVCSSNTMERVIDPVIADLRAEYGNAIHADRIWRSRWIRVQGGIVFLRVIVVLSFTRIVPCILRWPADDRRTLTRTVSSAMAVGIVLTTLLEVMLLFDVPAEMSGNANIALLTMYLLPAVLPLSIPIALAIGVFCGFGNAPASRTLQIIALAVAIACSAMSFVTLGWLTPATNQRYRIEFSGRPDVRKGPHEQTIGELRQHIAFDAELARVYYHRWALACAPLVFVPFALTVGRQRPFRRSLLATVGVIGYVVPYVAFSYPPEYGPISPLTAAWLPNLTLIAIAAVLRAWPVKPG